MGENVEKPSDAPTPRTPAYANFGSNTEKLLRFFEFTTRGLKSFYDELETKIGPEVLRLATETAKRGTPKDKQASDQEARDASYAEQDLSDANAETDNLVQTISDILVKPPQKFTDGLLAIREWIPVLLVTTVETYLKDVLVYVAKVDPMINPSKNFLWWSEALDQ